MTTTAQDKKSSLLLWHEGLETLLVSTPSFRARCGVANRDEARRHVYWDETDEAEAYDAADQQNLVRPCAIISQQMFRYTQYGVDSSIQLAASGGLALMLVDNARHRDDHKASRVDFLQFAGSVIDELACLSGSGDYVPFNAFDVIDKPLRTPYDQREADDWWSLVAMCSFGGEG